MVNVHFEVTPIVLYLPVEIKTRELDAAIFTAVRSLAYGFIPIVGTRQAIHSHIMCRRDRAAILLWKSDIDARLKDIYSDHISHFCVLDQEIGPNVVDYYSATVERVNGSSSRISRWYTVGPKAQEAGLRIFGSRSRMVGWPRIDLWRHIELGFSSSPTESPHPKPYVLLALTGDLSDSDSYEKLLSFIKAWSLHDQTPDLILRPHPTASISEIEKDLRSLEKVHFNTDLDSLRWIENARAIIHNGSTVAVTAALMGIQCYFIGDTEPENPDETPRHNLPLSISVEIFDLDDFLGFYRNSGLTLKDASEIGKQLKELIHLPTCSSTDLMLADLVSLKVLHQPVNWFHRLRRLTPSIHYQGLRGTVGRLKKGALEFSRTTFPSWFLEQSFPQQPRSKFPDGLTIKDFERFRMSYDRLEFDFKFLGDGLCEVKGENATF